MSSFFNPITPPQDNTVAAARGFDFAGRLNVPYTSPVGASMALGKLENAIRDRELRMAMGSGIYGSTLRGSIQGLTNTSILGG